MSIFKNILFLQDYPSDARTTEDSGHSYAQGYGNHIASAKAFAPLGHAHAIERNAIAAPRGATRSAEGSRPLETCG